MQSNSLSSLLVKVLYLTKLSIYRVESKESNIADYTQLYKLQIMSHFKIPLIFKINALPLYYTTQYVTEFRIWSTNLYLINLTKRAHLGVGALETYTFEYSQHDLPNISWNQTNVKA